jgi:transposase
VISGIIEVLKSGGRSVDAPPEYGPKKTLYNRYVRWAAKGVWVDLFHALAQAGGLPAQALIDSTAVKARHSESGGKKGGTVPMRSADRVAAQGDRTRRATLLWLPRYVPAFSQIEKPSPCSKHFCVKPLSAASTSCGIKSAPCSRRSRQRNAQASPLQAMSLFEKKPL